MNPRPATSADVSAVKKLLYETWIDTYGHFVPVEVLNEVTAAWHEPQKLAAEILSDSPWLVIETEGGELCAMVSGHWSKKDVITIDRLYVHPRFQRKGLGFKLYEALLARCPDAALVHLEVEELNPLGRAFYQKLGFEEGLRVRQDLGSVEAYIIKMKKTLK